MSKKERVAVAVIVLAALVAGLFLVYGGIEQAKADQTAVMERAMSNLGELPEQELPAEETEENTEEIREEESPVDGEREESDSVSQPSVPDQSQEGEVLPPALPQADGVLLTALEQGDFNSLETLKALGLLDETVRPSLGTAELDPQTLSAWMTTESAEALAARAALQGAQAVADGLGSEDNAQLRAFARSQGTANYLAEINRLEETALELSVEYLYCERILEVQKEVLAVFQELEQRAADLEADLTRRVETMEKTVEALEKREEQKKGDGMEDKSSQTDEPSSELELAQGELNRLRQQLEWVGQDREHGAAAVELIQGELTQREQELEEGAKAIQQAVGNPAELELVFHGVLNPVSMLETDVETGVTQALDSRNELKKAAYDIIRAEKQLTQLRYQYPPDAPELLAQQEVLIAAQAGILELADRVEQDIRQQYGTLEELSQKLAQPEPQRPEETAEQYAVTEEGSLGPALLASWEEYRQGQIQYAEATAQMNVLALRLEHGIGVGTVSVDIVG